MNYKKIKLNGKQAGEIRNNIYITHRDPNKHYFFKFKGYGVSEKVLSYLIENDIQKIIIRTPDRDYLFKTLDFYMSDKIHYDGDDKQYFKQI